MQNRYGLFKQKIISVDNKYSVPIVYNNSIAYSIGIDIINVFPFLSFDFIILIKWSAAYI